MPRTKQRKRKLSITDLSSHTGVAKKVRKLANSKSIKSSESCVCGLGWSNGQWAMLQCGYCKYWFHNKCMELAPSDPIYCDEFECPNCGGRTQTQTEQPSQVFSQDMVESENDSPNVVDSDKESAEDVNTNVESEHVEDIGDRIIDKLKVISDMSLMSSEDEHEDNSSNQSTVQVAVESNHDSGQQFAQLQQENRELKKAAQDRTKQLEDQTRSNTFLVQRLKEVQAEKADCEKKIDELQQRNQMLLGDIKNLAMPKPEPQKHMVPISDISVSPSTDWWLCSVCFGENPPNLQVCGLCPSTQSQI